MPALEIEALSVRRGPLRVVNRVSIDVPDGSIVGLLGLNGAGKTSLLASLGGILPSESGAVRVYGEDVTRLPAWERCKRGLVLVPAGRHLFPSISVLDNLLVGGHLLPRQRRTQILTEVFDLFPILAEKKSQRARDLSGGQQQMLALGRGLMAAPKILMLDEPSEGLAPLVVDQMFDAIRRLRDERALTILLAEQNAGVLDLIDQITVMHSGTVTDVRDSRAADATAIGQYMFGN